MVSRRCLGFIYLCPYLLEIRIFRVFVANLHSETFMQQFHAHINSSMFNVLPKILEAVSG